jgi:hypothetical protein
MSGRNIRFDPECDAAARLLGGYEAIDESLFIYLEALDRNPEAFPKVNTDWGSVRYIRIKAFGNTPELLWHFILEANGDVLITHVEQY